MSKLYFAIMVLSIVIACFLPSQQAGNLGEGYVAAAMVLFVVGLYVTEFIHIVFEWFTPVATSQPEVKKCGSAADAATDRLITNPDLSRQEINQRLAGTSH